MDIVTSSLIQDFSAMNNTNIDNRVPSYYFLDDTSNFDYNVTTPTNSLADSSSSNEQLSSSMSSSSSFATIKSPTNYVSIQKRISTMSEMPLLLDSNANELIMFLEKKVQVLEQEVNQHIKREIELESQLQQERQASTYKPTLNRMKTKIDEFLINYHSSFVQPDTRHFHYNKYDDWLIGDELPALFGDFIAAAGNTINASTNNSQSGMHISLDKVFLYRLKSVIEQSQSDNKLTSELSCLLDAWQKHNDNLDLQNQSIIFRENNRITKLLQALNKSLATNKILKKNLNITVKKYQYHIKKIQREKDVYEKKFTNMILQQQNSTQEKSTFLNEQCEKNLSDLKNTFNSQIKDLELVLANCQEEKDEYEKTLEIVRREMESMLDELEDARQQKIRFKMQSSRLKASLEEIQKKASRNIKTQDKIQGVKNLNEDNEEYDDKDAEGNEALRLLYNEAERQAMDLDRECRRQSLTLSTLRKELKQTEEKYQVIRIEKNKQQNRLEQENRDLNRNIKLLEIEKGQLVFALKQHEQKMLTSNDIKDVNSNYTVSNDKQHKEHLLYQAKIHALQIALKAAKSDAAIQRIRIYHLEQQNSLLDLCRDINQLQYMFERELLSNQQKCTDSFIIKQNAHSIQYEQAQWKKTCENKLQKQFDLDLLCVTRELRFVSSQLVELENETEMIQSRHKADMARIKHQTKQDGERKLEQVIAGQRLVQQDLKNQLDDMYQKNQTLKDQMSALYCRNMILAQKLGSM